MWTGWNTEFHTQFSKQLQLKQTFGYMKPIMLPPTRNDVVLETLNRSKELANECDSSCIVVTYDLAIAKIAKQIQCTEHPQFDDIFIQFGQFHTELNIFSALGKIIEGSGAPYILGEAGVVAMGSLNRFLKGKNYNRCRRAHILWLLYFMVCTSWLSLIHI